MVGGRSAVDAAPADPDPWACGWLALDEEEPEGPGAAADDMAGKSAGEPKDMMQVVESAALAVTVVLNLRLVCEEAFKVTCPQPRQPLSVF